MKTKTLLLSLVLSFASTISVFAVYAPSGGGDGSVGSPYILLTPTDLVATQVAVNSAGGTGIGVAYFQLGGNIDMSTTAWIAAIGTSSPNYFKGNFDGKGYSITGLFLGTSGTPSSTNGNLGLFAYLNGATIKNLKVNVSFYLTKASTANFFGCGGIFNNAEVGTNYIDNCEVSGTIQFTLTGTVAGTAAVRVGGIGGTINNSGTAVVITNCFVNASLSADNSASCTYASSICGGFIAESGSGTIVKIANSYASGSVYARNNYSNQPIAGGIIGDRPTSSGMTSVYNCYASNTVKAYNSTTGSSAFVGGIIGYLATTDATQIIKNNIALNPSLTWVVGNTGTPSLNLYRIGLKQGTNDFSANTARDNMTLTSLKSATDANTGTAYAKTVTSLVTGSDGLDQANATMAADALTKLNAYVTTNTTFEGVTLKSWNAGLVGDSYFPVISQSTGGTTLFDHVINEPTISIQNGKLTMKDLPSPTSVIRVFDVMGHMVFNKMIDNNSSVEIPLSNVGMYSIQIQQNGANLTKKIMNLK